MDIEKAQNYLKATFFLTRSLRHSQALKYLSETDDIKAIDILATAIETHPRALQIKDIILALHDDSEEISAKDHEKIDRLWEIWSESRGEVLGETLKELKMPASQGKISVISLLKTGASNKIVNVLKKKMDEKRNEIASQIMRFYFDKDQDIRKEAIHFISVAPNEPAFNEELLKLWAKSGEDAFFEIIHSQNRLPESAALEGLYYLIAEHFEEYKALDKEEENLIENILEMTCKKLRLAINEKIAQSGDVQLRAAYQQVLVKEKDESDLLRFVNDLAKADDEEGLFEAARHMNLPGLLDLCERWGDNGWRPEGSRRKSALVENAVNAYKKIGRVTFQRKEKLPEGVSDLFDYWERQSPGDDELKSGLQSDDPMVRLRSFYLGISRGLIDPDDLKRASESEHWPDRLAARMLAPEFVSKDRNEHVQWLNMLADLGVRILDAKSECKPNEYDYWRAEWEKEKRKAPQSLKCGLIEILHCFQQYYNTAIEARDNDSAPVSEAIRIEQEVPLEEIEDM